MTTGYMDCCSPTQPLLDIAKPDSEVTVLEIVRRRQLRAKSSIASSGGRNTAAGFHRDGATAAGVPVYLRRVPSRSVVEWATPTSCC